MRAILVSVDYGDLLAVTLPRNRHHFDDVWVVTNPRDAETQRVAAAFGAKLHMTGAFYDGGATFNKWKALEEGLDAMGRSGWLCVMDADVVWPREAPLELAVGTLTTPRRRMLYNPTCVPDEREWRTYRQHPEQEWSGYSQIFHASDPVLGSPPWHEVDWRHAGGADSFFQAKWPAALKRRPAFEVLHLGQDGANWCGRATPRLDGVAVPEAETRRAALHTYMAERRRTRRFDHEKLPSPGPGQRPCSR